MSDAILITGGSGYLARHLAMHMLRSTHPPRRLVLLARGEHRMAEAMEYLGQYDQSDILRGYIGDVRDLDRLKRAMRGVDIVIHAAALKRIEVGTTDPEEMVQTNVMGTSNVIRACRESGISKALFISSDKAYRPTSSAYGLSKALAERLFLSANQTSGMDHPRFSVVRYGNVAGATGSVIPRWRAMIANGAKIVPCTDPDCTRFWMTVDEAVELIVGMIETMKGGEIGVPVLPAFRLGDLAEAMGVGLEVTGLPAFEKKHESMDEHQNSDKARRMSVAEIRDRLGRVL